MVHGEDVKGFNELEVNQDIFKAFLNNFYNSWGSEARETIIPISVNQVDNYLRFDYRIYGDKRWLHVKGANTWY
ncbi:hypothetical protein [Clostridium algidicarnis]|uniref:hypothetical protein n=1 Tax=Clostridium algidicarnis TaxID=37659 RepID=UPI001C0BFCEB|nr:hypothetical protein [Clostridium algidicarnis]MBU3203739.1 hypothetical protein [Clostridium algidicarnis]MBU3211893.1 hypothetical protein [Clostridium algidicarnis]MBU3221601.1 hypothetical protein [Clostridium algidicarnis]